MPEITPSFVMSYERRMRAITENEYARRLLADHIWHTKVMRNLPIEGATERVTWLLETATIEPIGPTFTGGLSFEGLVTQTAEYPTFKHGKGIKVYRDQIEDLRGTGLDILSSWSSQIGNEMAYYPQRLAAQLILNGANTDGSANAYDTVPYFADNSTHSIGGVNVHGHPYNPFRPTLGGYSNWLHGSSSGNYPGALPIDYSVTVDVALQNLGNLIAYIAGIKMPNGQDPRFLTPAFMLIPPKLAPRVRQLQNASFIAQAAATGGGSGDVKAVISGWGLGQPIVAQEFAATTSYTFNMPFQVASTGNTNFLSESVSGSDTSYYMFTEENNTSQLGGLLNVMRKPFKVTYYTGDAGGTGQMADLDRMDEFEYHVKGRMSVQYGHPYGVFRVDAS